MKKTLLAGAAIFSILFTAQAQAADLEIEAKGPLAPLKGTLTGPATADRPTILLLPGSGPVDRDGNSPLGLAAGTYRLLAQGLADDGVTVVRIDKRGLFGSKGAVKSADSVVVDDYIDDTRAWMDAIKAKTGVSCVWLMGHSEGGLFALPAARDFDDVCGLILLATPGRSMGELLREQLKKNPANAALWDEAFAAIDALQAGKRYDTGTMHQSLAPLFRDSVQDYLISAFKLKPADLIKQVEKPILILQGDRDLQVPVSDGERLKSANPKAELVTLKDMNHILKTVTSDDVRDNIGTYRNKDLPLAPKVIWTIAQFVKTHF